jgi:hypothetical protein
MIPVSDAWKDAHGQTLLPETFIEISCNYGDADAQESARATGTNEVFFSATEGISKPGHTGRPTGATLETNMWMLGGYMPVFPEPNEYNPITGDRSLYVSNGSEGSVTLTFPEVITSVVPGITITWWDGTHNEYATSFTVVAKNGTREVASTTVRGNSSVVTQVELELTNYDSITITVTGWSVPDHRVRISNIELGNTVVFGKEDIISFTHEQTGCLNSGEVPCKKVTFSINNVDKRWNPYDPNGNTKYFSERQRVTVSYGMDIEGVVEWHSAGTFYMSEWQIPANGIEARFVATDILEQLSNLELRTHSTTEHTGSLNDFIYKCLSTTQSLGVDVPSELKCTSSVTGIPLFLPYREKFYSIAEFFQLIANYTGCVLSLDRSNVLGINPLAKPDMLPYTISLDQAYSYPELELMKPLKAVSIAIDEDNTYVLNVASKGETLTVDNPLIRDRTQAARVAQWIAGNVSDRKIMRGEFRADPRLELYDAVLVETGSSTTEVVVLTNIKYTYNGSFHGTYEGHVI